MHFSPRQILQICILSLCLIRPAAGQGLPDGVVADTLDWRRYYPLEIGNTWEYTGIDGAPNQLIRTIVGDTVANGYRYFVRRDSIPLYVRPPVVFTFYVRYDTAGTVVTLDDIAADTASLPLPFPYSGGDFLAHFDLRSAFGDTLFHDEPQVIYDVSGGYHEMVTIYGEQAKVDALKCLHGDWWRECYATDIGFVHGGSLEYYFLTYAKIAGKQYGTSHVTSLTANASPPSDLSIDAVFPNPTRETFQLVYAIGHPQQVRLTLVNALGQQIYSDVPGFLPAGQYRFLYDMSGLASGIYFIRLTSDTGREAVRSLLVYH
ncbi:MAG: T9SS type A sorting domain-containing protein [Rhodothermales bacterium]|nr:T9SS type A sorting domain-containing protein [Rhodothermales bacterium]